MCLSWLNYGQGTSPQLSTAWQALYQNQRLDAQKQFEAASQSSSSKAEAYLGLGIISWYDEQIGRAHV